jgi:lipoprotein-anchoring transpeptidase ErfK/SrfK
MPPETTKPPRNVRARPERRAAPEPSPRRLRLGWIAGLVALVGLGLGAAEPEGCGGNKTSETDVEPATESAGPASTGATPNASPPRSAIPPEPSPSATASATATATATPPEALPQLPAEYTGPLLGAMAHQTPIYPEPRFGDERLGYIRQGGRVPVDAQPIKKPNCKQGWYKLIEGGFVCGKYATLDGENPRVKLGVKAPDLEAVVPYQYAYNRFHGTPLYKALPTREEMLRYEPYLEKDKGESKAKSEEEPSKKPDRERSNDDEANRSSSTDDGDRRKGKHRPDDDPAGNVPTGDSPDAKQAVDAVSALETDDGEKVEPEKPWWQQDDKERKPNVSLADLERDADGNLAKRMVKGFFIAVDKTFAWNGRSWYRTTGGLVAPTDRMWINKAPESKGIAWPDGTPEIAFVLGEKAVRYEPSKDGKKMVGGAKFAAKTAVPVTVEEREVAGTKYRKSVEGFWVKAANVTFAKPGKRPSDVGESERWVDVDLTTKTLVLMEGDKPVYAALISPGKRSRIKKKDHATPTGAWRIREKHVTTTMDGDGAAGDLPYSIEDVPFVAYFKGSYALHAAFWHSNFGREMSHGCVNLAPRDAKHVFDFVEPRVPRGWHGAFATKERPGSMVVVHE